MSFVSLPALRVALAAWVLTAPSLRAGEILKADAGAELTDPASWIGAVPSADDTAVWNPASLGAGLTLGADASWGGMRVEGALSDIDISGPGTLTLGAGGLDASDSGIGISLSQPIAVDIGQTWWIDGSLTLDGPVSGAGPLTVHGSAELVRNHFGYLTPGAAVIFPNTTLADFSRAGAVMNGAWVSQDDIPSNGFLFANDGTSATFQLRFLDDVFTKCVKVELAQDGPDITGRVVYAKFISGFDLGFDFDTGGSTAPIATGPGEPGYGVSFLSLAGGVGSEATFSGNSTHNGGMTFHGGAVRGGTGVAWDEAEGGSFGTGPLAIRAGTVFTTTGPRALGGGRFTTREVSITDAVADIAAAGPGGEYLHSLELQGGVLGGAGAFFRTPDAGCEIRSTASGSPSRITTGIDLNFGALAIEVADGPADEDLVISGNITESGGPRPLIKSGPGTLVLAGGATRAGSTSVDAGTLRLAGDHSQATGTLTVASGARLDGTGTRGGPVIALPGSTVAPGAPSGTLTAGSGSSLAGELEIRINGTSSSQLAVSGNVDVEGLVVRVQLEGSPTRESYVILTADSVSGTPAAPTNPPPGYDFVVTDQQISLIQTGSPPVWKVPLLYVFAHPDDEGIFGGGLLPYYTQVRNLPVAAVNLVTRNPNGSDPLTSGGRSRVDEMRRAVDVYAGQPLGSGAANGRDYLSGNIWLVTAGLIDTGCCSTPPDDSWSDVGDGRGWGISSGVTQVTPGFGNPDGIADGRLAVAWTIARQIRRFRPEVVVTCHDLEGDYGHSNHTANAIGMIDAWSLAADPGVDIDGLPPWQASKLYLRGGPTDNRDSISYDFTEEPFPGTFTSDGGIHPLFHDFFEDSSIDGQTPRQVADAGLKQHVSQGGGNFSPSTVFLSGENFDGHHSEWWTLYRSTVGPDTIEPAFTVTGDTTATTYTGWAQGDFFENLTIFADRDGDGLPDAWEFAWFGGIYTADPAADPDGDGRDNLTEFTTGTDPTVPDAPDFAIGTDPLAIDFSVPSAAWIDPQLARRYRLVHSPDLGDWSTILAEGIGDGTPLRYLIGNEQPNADRGFYRLEIETVNTP